MAAAPRMLVVAGHDPSGAGLDADRDALAGLALTAHFIVTAWTAQDARGLQQLGAREVGDWLAEARAELPVAALKFGLLPGRPHVRAAAEFVHEARERAGGMCWAVVDPVLASSSGARFLDERAAREYLVALLPTGVVLTPNIDELAELTGKDRESLVRDPPARLAAARALLERGATAVIVKAGHGTENPARDLVLEAGKSEMWLAHPRIPGGKVRGSGCRFATRVAANLALGTGLVQAARDASEHVCRRLKMTANGA